MAMVASFTGMTMRPTQDALLRPVKFCPCLEYLQNTGNKSEKNNCQNA